MTYNICVFVYNIMISIHTHFFFGQSTHVCEILKLPPWHPSRLASIEFGRVNMNLIARKEHKNYE